MPVPLTMWSKIHKRANKVGKCCTLCDWIVAALGLGRTAVFGFDLGCFSLVSFFGLRLRSLMAEGTEAFPRFTRGSPQAIPTKF